MNNKNSQLANLVINWIALLGINLSGFTTDQDTPFNQEYLESAFNSWGLNSTDDNQDADIFIYLEPDSDVAFLIDGETWHNNPAEGQEDYELYHLSLKDMDLHIAIN